MLRMRCEASDKQQRSLDKDVVPFRVATARGRGSNWGCCQAETKASQREADEILYVSGAGLVQRWLTAIRNVKKRSSNRKKGGEKDGGGRRGFKLLYTLIGLWTMMLPHQGILPSGDSCRP